MLLRRNNGLTNYVVQLPMTWPEYHYAFREAAADAGFTGENLWHSSPGNITAWTKNCDHQLDGIYLSAGMHGDEPAGPLAILELMREGFFSSNQVSWAVCPVLNPTGLVAGTRENAAGIDLNRDYRAITSPEIIAHTAWFSRCLQPPALFLSLHEDWESTGFYLYEINHHQDRPQRAHEILNSVRDWFPIEISPVIDGHAVREPGWIYHPPEADEPEGWPEAIYLSHLGCPLSFTFETPSQMELSARVSAHKAAVKTACNDFCRSRN